MPLSTLKDELTGAITRTQDLLEQYRYGSGSEVEGTLRQAVPQLTELVTECYQREWYQDAIALLESLLELGKELGERRVEALARSLFGTVLKAKGQFREALKNFQLAVRIYRGVHDARGEVTTLCKMGELLIAQLRYQEALENFGRGMQINPNHVGCHVGKGTALELLGREEEAIWHFRYALKLDPQNKQARLGLDAMGVDS
jgi:tetratricopeptide (TPR) repeat protein